ncbi:MAG: ABC transporter permease [Actinomycetota bacterium]|nr:ABC transporter permease [Actinomycetota bacterium]
MTFVGLMFRNLRVKPLRSALTAIAVAVGVASGVTLGIVTHSLRETAVQILQIGKADFSVTQKGVTDVLNSVMDEGDLVALGNDPDVESTVGVLVSIEDLGDDNPMFLEIGIQPERMEEFGVRLVQGEVYGATAPDEVMLGYRASRNLGKTVGDTLQLGEFTYRVVGIFATDQEFGDSAAMLPLVTLQATERKPGDVTIAFVRVRPGADVDALRQRIERDFPQMITVRTASEFGRADRNLQLLSAADDGATILALTIGVIIVANTMLITFLERTREFGVLRAVGWSRRRVMSLVIGETLILSLVGASLGIGISYLAIQVLEHVGNLAGVLHPEYTVEVFRRALLTATGIGFLGALYPALRAALLVPLEALRRE